MTLNFESFERVQDPSVARRLALLEQHGLLLLVESAAALHNRCAAEALGTSRFRLDVAARREAMAALYGVGLRLSEIGRYFDRDHTSVDDALRRLGVERRPTVRSRGKHGDNLSDCSGVSLVGPENDAQVCEAQCGDAQLASNSQDLSAAIRQFGSSKQEGRPGLQTRRPSTPEVEVMQSVDAAEDGCKVDVRAGVA